MRILCVRSGRVRGLLSLYLHPRASRTCGRDQILTRMPTGTSGSGLFGNTTTTQTAPGATGGLFGSTTQGQSSLFGATQPQQQQAQMGSLFNPFGQQNKPAAGGLFGGSTIGGSSALSGSTLLGSTNNLFASKSTVAPNTQQDAQTQFVQLAQRMEGIAQAWNPNSPQCRFQVSIPYVRVSTLVDDVDL